MSIQIVGYSGAVPEVDSTAKALRISPQPPELALGGAYSICADTGIMAAGIAGASEILQFRWLSTTHVAKIRYVRISPFALGTAFAAGNAYFDMTRVLAWSVVGTGGGVILATSGQLKCDSSGLSSQMATASEANGSIRVATTAALGAGTKTLADAPLRGIGSYVPATAFINLSQNSDGELWNTPNGDEHGLTLRASEGFVLRCTVPATGTWSARISLGWHEKPI